ncbi:MAG: DUF4231 domain-containing protein [Clostridia bacterium]|nr:DUF4231 domain-containing protein [Clostridia bacterium]
MRRQSNVTLWFKIISAVLLLGAVIYFTYVMTGFLENKQKRQPERIREVIKSECVQCYALEGSYPPDLEYLARNYGLILDKEHYYYYYEAFSSNIMPDVEVYEKGP